MIGVAILIASAAGLLSELFVGALLVYAHGMGTVMRCPNCEGAVLCVTRTATQIWLDPTGARRIIIAAEQGSF
jgi:hypothetical protein